MKMAEFEAESGAQLVARLRSQLRPQIDHLDPQIFPNNGPFPREVIEISGEIDTGKTTLLMNIMARIVLPTNYGGKDHRNHGPMVLFLATDNDFNLINFMAVLEKCARSNSDSAVVMETDISDVVNQSLKNITFRRCYNWQQFELSLVSLDQLLNGNNHYCLLVVDSISAFYWTEVSETNKIRMETYLKNLLKKLTRIINDHNLVLVYTKPSYFVSNANGNGNVSTRIDHVIELFQKDTEESTGFNNNFVYKFCTPKTNRTIFWEYDFDCYGINWKK